jgi:hypothetical protein
LTISRQLDKRLQKRVFVLVDETNANVGGPAFTFLLKSAKFIVAIGAGVSVYESVSEHFRLRLPTQKLFLKKEDLQSKGVLRYFVGVENGKLLSETTTLLSHLLEHSGGHIYPLMRLGELLVPKIKNGMSADEVIAHYYSVTFRQSTDFTDICARVSPPVDHVNVCALFARKPDLRAIRTLERAGFCAEGKIVSQLLVDSHLATLGSPHPCKLELPLMRGVAGLLQLLVWALPRIVLSEYDKHGGPTEDAITVALVSELASLQDVGTRLFNPRLVDAGTPARRPDMFFHNMVDTYVEATLTQTPDVANVAKFDEHISRFYEPSKKTEASGEVGPHYDVKGKDFAIINYQNFGTIPMKPSHKWNQVFRERVFTFVIPTTEVFLGNELVYPCAAAIIPATRLPSTFAPSNSRTFSSLRCRIPAARSTSPGSRAFSSLAALRRSLPPSSTMYRAVSALRTPFVLGMVSLKLLRHR